MRGEPGPADGRDPPARPRTAGRNAALGLIFGALALFAFLALIRALELDRMLLGPLLRIEAAGALGALVFAALVAALVPLLVPSLLLTLAAGALYGIVGGTLLIVAAETAGAVLALLLGRGFVARYARRWLVRHAAVNRALEAIGPDDWRSIALLRMIPFFPFKASNYALGLTRVSTGSFAIGTAIGLLPIALFNVHLGSVAGDLLALGAGDAGAPSSGWVGNLVALVFTGAVCTLAVRRATSVLGADDVAADASRGD